MRVGVAQSKVTSTSHQLTDKVNKGKIDIKSGKGTTVRLVDSRSE